jgi:hypothetical protein
MATRRLSRPALRDERGGILVLFGLLLPVVLLLGALSLDVGNWYVHKRHLQTQVDAAALAGGGVFGACFSNPSDGSSEIADEATKYHGGVNYYDPDPTSSLYNEQWGGRPKDKVLVLYNSQVFVKGGPGPDDTETGPDPVTGGACETPSLMFDVKASEVDLPLIYSFLGLPSVEAINAHARVELKKTRILKGSLPLAVPEVNPKHVTATFVNESGDVIGGPVDLSGPTATGSLNAWSGGGSVSVPAGAKVGVRIGVGQVAGPCGEANGNGGVGYVCYDYSNHSAGLVDIAGWSAGGTVAKPDRSAFEVWPVTACSGSPFFSETSLAGGAATCAAGVQAVVHPGSGAIDPAKVKSFEATISGSGPDQKASFTFTGGVWTTDYAFTIPADEGVYDISLEWQYDKGGKETYSNVQQIYSASDDAGPIKVVTLSGGGGTGAPYALPEGSQTVNVNVALEGTLHLSAPGELIMLRFTGGSRTTAVECDGPGGSAFGDAIRDGCKTPYQINPSGVCPDPAPPSGAADCVPLKTGSTVGPTLHGLDDRFAACPPYAYPNYEQDDPRIVKLMITDFSALDGSGKIDVPVTNFATFYVAGWTGSKCAGNPPAPLAAKKGAIWGFFVKYAAPDPESAGNETCDRFALTPCVPVLTR